MKNKWVQRSLLALWPPMIWASSLSLDIFVLGGERPKWLFFRILEDILFMSSFLLYRVRSSNEGVFSKFFWPAAIQFFFWWAISFGLIWIFQSKLRKYNE